MIALSAVARGRHWPPTLLIVAALGSAACSALPVQEETAAPARDEQRFHLLLGYREHDDVLPEVDAFDSLDGAVGVGLEFSRQARDDFLGFEIGFAGGFSTDDEVADVPPFGLIDLDLDLSTIELYGGVVKTFRIGEPLRPYVGAGLSLVLVEGEASSAALGGSDSEDDSSPAGYVHAGLLFDVSKTFHLGLDGRALMGTDLDLDGLEVDADYLQLALVLGWHF